MLLQAQKKFSIDMSNSWLIGDKERDIAAANAAIDPEEHRNAIWELQAKIYEDQPYVFMYSPKRKIVIHKRFDNANTYFEKPGFVLHNFTGLNMTGSLYEVDNYGRGSTLQLKNLILPAITLGIRPLSVIIQLCRNSLLEVLSMDYVRTATAKGLNKFTVIFKHALRNALNPVVTAVSGWFASLLAGAVFVEYIFAWNGIGKEIVDALNKMDLPVVMGSVLFIASIFVIINIIVDLIYGWLDPRIRIS